MQRIQKFLADLGLASRREIEQWIRLQRIKVNGKVVELGTKVVGTEEFRLDNKILSMSKKLTVKEPVKIILYHKPAGKICTRSDPQNRPTVFADLPELVADRWISIGRLDLNTSGLLLFTNNGDVAHQLMHPSYNQEREYMVRVFGAINDKMLSSLTKGVKLDDGIARFKKITLIKQNNANSWYTVILTEGKNREIKKLFASQGLIVNRLIRIRFGDIVLPKNLKAGEFKYLSYSTFRSETT
jgi:23S rRNA pseudouridine2605 synthase